MLRKLILPLCGRKKLYPLWQKIFILSVRGMNIGLGGGVNTSGENNVLAYVKEHSSSNEQLVIFDVGANKGDYAANLLHFFNGRNIHIHCFEPGHETFRVLTTELEGRENVTLNNFGLSDNKGESTLYYDKAGSALASLYKRQLDYFNIDFEEHEDVQLDTLDNYVKAQGIKRIDLLKLDVEGNELNVLKGAEASLSEGIIKAIQIEFGGCNIDSRTFIRDFWNILSKDFTMYRILRDGLVEIKQYHETIEIFSCTNFFFAKR